MKARAFQAAEQLKQERMREQWGGEELFGWSVRGVMRYRARKVAGGTGRRGLEHQDKTLMVLILELYGLLECPFLIGHYTLMTCSFMYSQPLAMR